MIGETTVTRLLKAQSASTTQTGAAVDLADSINPGGRNVKAVLDVGSLLGTAGTTLSVDCKIQDSNTTTAADFTDISGATFTQVTATAGAIAEIEFRTNKRYVRAVATLGTTVTGAVLGVYVVTVNRIEP